ncbi:hypothetical protein SAY87_030975 [Trapa incisa]|uniref:FLZ-type domain-containing protein n=1 Tax=Trapa incisa TaxID=236973 RepID=A0AAN7KJT1_9MYRT|nr:hypothetical protein SAY87_030975 [Trapa incisa]
MVGLSAVLESQKSQPELVMSKSVVVNSSIDHRGGGPLAVSHRNPRVTVTHHTSLSLLSPSSLLPYPKDNSSSSAQTANPSSFPYHHQPSPDFLDRCFLCRTRLLPGKDIYMYKGDRGFCSEECRCRQISLDDQATKKKSRNKNKKQQQDSVDVNFSS